MLDESRLVFLSIGNIEKIKKDLRETIEHAGNKDIEYLVKHPVIRLEREVKEYANARES